MLDTPTTRGPISPVAILASAPISWTLLSEQPSSVTVSVTTRHVREDAEERLAGDATYLLTREVDIVRDSWEVWCVIGPELLADDVDELCADVARAFESGVGVRYRDVPLVADAWKEAA